MKEIIGKRFRVSDLDEAGRWYSMAIARLTKFWKFSDFRVSDLCLDLVIAEAKLITFADLLNCKTAVDEDTNQPTETTFWIIWDASVIKAMTWSGHLLTAVYVVIGIYNKYVMLWHYKYLWWGRQIKCREPLRDSEVEMMKFPNTLGNSFSKLLW